MGKDPSAIKQEIEQTRERMGDTVEALGYKADVGARVKDDVQDRVDSVKGTLGDVVDNVKSAVSGATTAATSAVSGATNAATSAVTGATGAVSGTVNDRANTVTNRVSKLTDKVSKLNDGVSSKLADVDVNAKTKQAIGIAKENPIGLALAALAVGYLTGSLLPVSNVERERLGPIRDKVVDQAQAATHDLIEAGKAVVAETAQSVVSTAFSSAQSHGHDVIEAAKTRADQP